MKRRKHIEASPTSPRKRSTNQLYDREELNSTLFESLQVREDAFQFKMSQ